jgi:hypothetical protein
VAHEFTATIHKVGINPCVDVPRRVSEALARRGFVHVLVTLKGHTFRATFVPTGNNKHRLYVNGEMRRKANVDVGDKIRVSTELDTKPTIMSIPKEFAAALEKNGKARLAFGKLPPSHRREILAYLNFLKRPETLRRNIEKVIANLSDRG